MRRTIVACVILAAAIAAPGVVVAAMSTGGQTTSFATATTTGPSNTPVQILPIGVDGQMDEAEVRPAMIYTHVLNKGGFGVRSPADRL